MKSKHIFFIATSFVLYSSISLATIETGISVINEAQECAQDVKEWAQDVKECAQSDHFIQCMMIRKELRRSAKCKIQFESQIQKNKEAAEKTPGCAKNQKE